MKNQKESQVNITYNNGIVKKIELEGYVLDSLPLFKTLLMSPDKREGYFAKSFKDDDLKIKFNKLFDEEGNCIIANDRKIKITIELAD